MGIYTKPTPGSTEHFSPNSSKHSAAFAESARDEAFRGRDRSLAREPGLEDRLPHQQPKRLGEIVEEITAAAARRAIRYWQKEAALAITQAEREEALSIAAKIARAAGLD